MFACIIHCGAKSLITTEDFPVAKAGHCSAMHHKNAGKDERDRDCCKKHSNYTIRENIKPGFDSQVAQMAALVRVYHKLCQ